METEIGVAVLQFFENVKYLGLSYTHRDIEEIIAETAEKPAGVTWDTWDEYIKLIQYGACIGADLMLKDMQHYEYEDVMGIVLEIMTSVFRYVRGQLGQTIQNEIELADQAALRIQSVWLEAVSNPEYQICKNRLMREFNSMSVL
jgi:hypothetical protein